MGVWILKLRVWITYVGLDLGLDPGRRCLDLECEGLDFGLGAGCEDLDVSV